MRSPSTPNGGLVSPGRRASAGGPRTPTTAASAARSSSSSRACVDLSAALLTPSPRRGPAVSTTPGSAARSRGGGGGDNDVASSWAEFLRVLKAQGVSRRVVASANAADRVALAEGVFPQSPRRREEVLLAWPDDPHCLFPTSLPPRVSCRTQQSPRRASRSRSRGGDAPPPPAHPWLSPAVARARASSRCRSRSAGRDGGGGGGGGSASRSRSRSRSHSRGAEGTPQRRRPSPSPLKRRHHHDPPLDGSGGDSSALFLSSSLGSGGGGGNARDTSLSSSRRSRSAASAASAHAPASAAAFDRHGAVRAMHASPYRSCRGALPVGTVVVVARPPRGSSGGGGSRSLPAALVGAKGKTIDTVDSAGVVPVAFAPPLHEVLLPVSCLLRCAGETDVNLSYRPDPRHVGRDARWLPVDLPVALPPLPPAHRGGGGGGAVGGAPAPGLGLLRKAAAEAEAVFGQASVEAGRAHGEVAAVCLAVGDAEGAVGSARRAVDAVLGGGGGGVCLLREVNTLARALSDLGEGGAALDLLERTLEDNEVAEEGKEEDEAAEDEAAAWASTAHNHAVLCQLRCEAARGVAAAREALQRLARLRGTAHASAVLAACNLAVLLSDVGAVGEASHHAARCLRLLSAYQATPDTPLDDLKQTLLAILVDRSSHAAAAAAATAASSVLIVKEATESAGATWAPDATLCGVMAGSPADRCGLRYYRGRRVVFADGKSVTRGCEVRGLLDGTCFAYIDFAAAK